MTKTIKRTIKGTDGTESVREAVCTFPSVTPVLDSILEFCGQVAAAKNAARGENDDEVSPIAVLAQWVNQAVGLRVQSIAYQTLGAGDEASKQIAKAIKALKSVPGMNSVPESTLMALVMSSPEMRSAVESASKVEPKITLDLTVDRLFVDQRGASDDSE